MLAYNVLLNIHQCNSLIILFKSMYSILNEDVYIKHYFGILLFGTHCKDLFNLHVYNLSEGVTDGLLQESTRSLDSHSTREVRNSIPIQTYWKQDIG